MSLWFFVVCKNWASSRLRLLLSVLGIALGVAIVVAIYVMDHNTIQSRLLAADPQRGRVDLELVAADAQRPEADVRADLAARPGVEQVAVWRQARGTLVHREQRLEIEAFGLGPLPAGPFAHYSLHRGRDLEAADDQPGGAILLGSEAARLLGCDVGDRLTLREPERAIRVECKDGQLVPIEVQDGHQPFVTEVTVAGILTADRLGRRADGQLLVCGVQLARRLLPRGGDVYHVLRQPGADLDRLRRELQASYTVADMRAALIGEGADERAFRNGLKVLGGLALLLGMYVVFQTLSHSLVARVRQLGLLRCLGTGTGAITRIFLADALALGAVGSALGVGLGLLLALLLRHYRVSSLGLGKDWTTFEVPWFPVGWTAALGVLFTLAGAMFPLVRARRVPALEILRARGLAPGKNDGIDLLAGVNLWMFGLLVLALPLAYLAMTPLAAEEGAETRMVLVQLAGLLAVFGSVLLLAPQLVVWLGRVLLWPLRLLAPLSGWLVAKALQRNPGRIAAAVCGLSAVLLALLGLKALTYSLRAEVDQFSARALDGRMFLRIGAATAAQAAQLAQVPGVAGVDLCEGEERSGGFVLRGMAVASLAGDGGALEGQPELVRRYADPRIRSLVVSRRLAKARNWRPGDFVPMLDRNRIPVTYVVLHVDDGNGFDADERAWAVTSPHWLRTDFCIGERCVELVSLRLAAGADPSAITAAARQLLGHVPISKTGEFVRGYLHRDVGRDFFLFDLLLLLMLALAGVGLLNGMTIAALGRIRELGVLRALGLSRRALTGSFLLEGVLVALLASLLSIGLSVPMSYVLVLGMNQVAALDAPVTLPWRWYALVPIAALATALAAAFVPARRALRQSPGESVRYE